MAGRGRSVYVPDDEWKVWKLWADVLGIPVSEMVRLGVGELVRRELTESLPDSRPTRPPE